MEKQLHKRILSATVLVSCLSYLFYLGPLWIILICFMVQLRCYNEVLNIAYDLVGISKLPSFKLIPWYLLAVVNYYLFCENLGDYMNAFTKQISYIEFLMKYHKIITFCLYLCTLLWFCYLLKHRYETKQFKLLALCHALMIIIVFQAYMAIYSIINGLIWVLMISITVQTNDACAYIFGKLFGKTPLIQLSPKKTWEGFIAGGMCTIVIGTVAGHFLSKYEYFTCPVKYQETSSGITTTYNCTKNFVFTPHEYTIDIPKIGLICFTSYPFIFHAFILALFASIVAPFGGFFASGLKRAYNVKNFADTIPGHGGVLDRFDCMYFMLTFVKIYIDTFIQDKSVDNIFAKVLRMDDKQQIQFYNMFKRSLQ